MRYFLAIPLPEDVKQKLHSINSSFSHFKGLRFVSPDNMHLSLLFLGENGASKKIDELKNINFDPFKLVLKKVSLFPESGKVRLVWVELEKSESLIQLQDKLSTLFGIKSDFKPHITLARVKNLAEGEREALFNVVKNLALPKTSFSVKSFKLYSSELTVLGPVHRVVEYFESSKSVEK